MLAFPVVMKSKKMSSIALCFTRDMCPRHTTKLADASHYMHTLPHMIAFVCRGSGTVRGNCVVIFQHQRWFPIVGWTGRSMFLPAVVRAGGWGSSMASSSAKGAAEVWHHKYCCMWTHP